MDVKLGHFYFQFYFLFKITLNYYKVYLEKCGYSNNIEYALVRVYLHVQNWPPKFYYFTHGGLKDKSKYNYKYSS